MSALTDAKVALATVLEPVVTTYPYLPPRITPPVAVITPGSPYLAPGDTFGTFLVRLQIDLVTPTSANETATEGLDTLIDDVVVELVNNGYSVDTVSTPYAMETGGATYLAASVTINKQINL